jgi:hypothetical protein
MDESAPNYNADLGGLVLAPQDPRWNYVVFPNPEEPGEVLYRREDVEIQEEEVKIHLSSEKSFFVPLTDVIFALLPEYKPTPEEESERRASREFDRYIAERELKELNNPLEIDPIKDAESIREILNTPIEEIPFLDEEKEDKETP